MCVCVCVCGSREHTTLIPRGYWPRGEKLASFAVRPCRAVDRQSQRIPSFLLRILRGAMCVIMLARLAIYLSICLLSSPKVLRGQRPNFFTMPLSFSFSLSLSISWLILTCLLTHCRPIHYNQMFCRSLAPNSSLAFAMYIGITSVGKECVALHCATSSLFDE